MKALRIIVLLAAVQAGLYLAWRTLDAPTAPAPTAPTALDRPLPALTLYGPGDTPAPLPDGPVVLHLWATWCPPCRAELPSLLAFAADAPLPVLAVATDPEWSAIERFVATRHPSLRRADATAIADALGIDALPVTLVIADRRLRARFDGPRDWSDPQVRAAALAAAGLGR